MTPQSEEQAVSGVAGFQNTTLLGKKLEHPYSVENMRKAWDSLKTANPNGRISREERDITTTHLYVKFMPHSSEDMDVLARDSTLDLYDYPLDYEILEHGDYYHDPNVPLDQPTPQYCAVKVGYPFPSEVDYEILEHLFAPDDYSDENIASGRASFDDAWVDALVNESLRLTGNLEDAHDANEENEPRGRRRSKWRPAGRIRVWDNTLGSVVTRSRQVFDHWDYSACRSGGGYPIPLRARAPTSRCKRAVYRTENYSVTLKGAYVGLEGVEVRATRWGVHTHRGITNAQGNYSCDGRFRRRANYRIKWERYHFKIRRKNLSGAKYDGPKKTGDWNLNIAGGPQEYYATIFRPAYHYYYKNIKGLRRPPENGQLKTQMKIRAHLERSPSSTSSACHRPWARFASLGNHIKVYKYTGFTTLQIYSTMIHELSHASHWNMDKHNYNRMNHCGDTRGLRCSGHPKVAESWGRGVEWELTRMVYPSYVGRGKETNDYTLVVADMIDSPETDSTNKGFGSREGETQDQVSGYTIRQIEDALDGQSTWNGWRDNIKNRYQNGTRNNLDALFRAYE